MLNRTDMHLYQTRGVHHILDNPHCALFLEMGLGKTVTTLTAINDLKSRNEAKMVLVIAPKRVATHTWPSEVAEWAHLRHLKVSVVSGTEKQRLNALRAKSDIYTIGRDNVQWLVAQYKGFWPFDTVVIDELSSFKNHDSNRFKALRSVRPLMKRVIGLTGTPAPNDLIDLWSQVFLLDRGERLEATIGAYRRKYFNEADKNGHVVYSYKLKNEKENILGDTFYQDMIYAKISDICISMKSKDWLDLPECLIQDVNVEMDSSTRARYETFEKEAVLAFAGEEITAVNAAALTNKLLQLSNGAVYWEGKKFLEVHDVKLKALEEIIEAANGEPVLCFYNFQHDVERIRKHLRKFNPHKLEGSADIDRWNAGEIPFLLAHPASAGHGLNMQKGGSIIAWFGLPWSLENYLQANARLNRQGQKKSVRIFRIAIKETMDLEVIKALDRKETGQEALLNAVKAKFDKYGL